MILMMVVMLIFLIMISMYTTLPLMVENCKKFQNDNDKYEIEQQNYKIYKINKRKGDDQIISVCLFSYLSLYKTMFLLRRFSSALILYLIL